MHKLEPYAAPDYREHGPRSGFLAPAPESFAMGDHVFRQAMTCSVGVHDYGSVLLQMIQGCGGVFLAFTPEGARSVGQALLRCADEAERVARAHELGLQ